MQKDIEEIKSKYLFEKLQYGEAPCILCVYRGALTYIYEFKFDTTDTMYAIDRHMSYKTLEAAICDAAKIFIDSKDVFPIVCNPAHHPFVKNRRFLTI